MEAEGGGQKTEVDTEHEPMGHRRHGLLWSSVGQSPFDGGQTLGVSPIPAHPTDHRGLEAGEVDSPPPLRRQYNPSSECTEATSFVATTLSVNNSRRRMDPSPKSVRR